MKPHWAVRQGKVNVWPVWLFYGENFLNYRRMYRRAHKQKFRNIRSHALRGMMESIVQYDRAERQAQEEADAHNQERMVQHGRV